MQYTVSKLITDLNRKVSPGNTSKSRDILGSIAEGARQFMEDVRPKELSRRVIIENALYDQVRRFSCPEDLNEKKIMQWYKLGTHSNPTGNSSTDGTYHPMVQVTNRSFDQQRSGFSSGYATSRQNFTIEWQSGVKFIKVTDFQGLSGATLNTMDSLTDNGSWNVFGNVDNLAEDHLTYVAGNGSLRFDINTSSDTGGLINYMMTPVDISEYFMVGKVFTWLNLPNQNQIQTVTLDLLTNSGDISTDYYSITVNSPHDTTAFQVGQNLMGFRFDLDTMNVVGLPDPKNVIGLRFTFVTNGTLNMNAINIDNVVMRKGAVFGIQYISEYIFEQASSGLWKLEPTDLSDIIHLEPATYNLLLGYCAEVLGQEIFSGAEGRKDLANLQAARASALKIYKNHNKTEFIDEQQFIPMSTARYGYYSRGYGNDGHRFDHYSNGDLQ